jgi:uncharacterized protein
MSIIFAIRMVQHKRLIFCCHSISNHPYSRRVSPRLLHGVDDRLACMVSRKDIQAFVDQVADRFCPSRVILFGSYANGSPTPDSDVDLLVIMPHRVPSAQLATRIRLACPRAFAMDLIVRSPAEIRRRLAMGDAFLSEITTNGILLHEGRRTRMGRQG